VPGRLPRRNTCLRPPITGFVNAFHATAATASIADAFHTAAATAQYASTTECADCRTVRGLEHLR